MILILLTKKMLKKIEQATNKKQKIIEYHSEDQLK